METLGAEKVCHIRERIADRIGVGRYRTWFGDSTQLTLDGDRLGVTVENPFVSRWISDNFMAELVDATRDVIGVEPHVEIQVTPHATTTSASPPAERTAPPPRTNTRESGSGAPTLRGDLSTLVVGPSNQLAYSAATSLVHRPGEGTRLLVLHGGCGLGKTHFLQGICNGVRRTHPGLEWRYISGEEFTNQFVAAVQARRVDLFRGRFRRVDVLVIDDIHFLANKRATQEEFLHTFNAVDAGGRAIVLSSDRHPRSIATLTEPLVNRLSAGMVVQIEPPDFQMRREILRRRALTMQKDPPCDVLDFIARRVTRNVRALEGVLHKLVALATVSGEPINLALARHAVEDYVDVVAQGPEAGDIERVVANYFGLPRDAVRSKARDRNTSLARALVVYLIREKTQMSFPEIARAISHKNHSTVLMAARRIQKALARNGAVAWATSSGPREMPLRDVLRALENDLARAQRASA